MLRRASRRYARTEIQAPTPPRPSPDDEHDRSTWSVSDCDEAHRHLARDGVRELDDGPGREQQQPQRHERADESHEQALDDERPAHERSDAPTRRMISISWERDMTAMRMELTTMSSTVEADQREHGDADRCAASR